MYIFFDTETNGLPKNYNGKCTDHNNWPQIIQIAWAMYNEREKLLREESYVIAVPFDFEINERAQEVHGYTKDEIMDYGIPIENAMKRFALSLQQSTVCIAHNMNFDSNIIMCEMDRLGMKNEIILFENMHQICTMLETMEFVDIKNSFGYKWPKLQELHQKLFGYEFEGAHSALVDVHATAKCYFELKKLGKII